LNYKEVLNVNFVKLLKNESKVYIMYIE